MWSQNLMLYPYSNDEMIFEFDINRGPPSYNMGSIIGMMKIKNNIGTFDFKGDDFMCNITFKFKNNNIDIDQNDLDNKICGFGGYVRASGVYKKENSSIDFYSKEIHSNGVLFPVKEMTLH